ncbi:MAG TPA: glycosyltransferase [Candidatus Saccharimonadales bacterium]|nr:glycosyltransferase [Candidatus Saccharimonadales bacterium]
MNILFFGTYNTKTTPRVQVMIDGLRAQGQQVTECNVPLKVPTAARVAMLRQPWRLPILAYRILECWVRLAFMARKQPRPDAIVVGHLGHFDIHLAKWLFRRVPRALDYMISGSETAQDRKASGGLKTKAIAWLDEEALRASDIVIVDTEEHRQALPEHHRQKGVSVLVGAPESWFAVQRQHRNTPTTPLSIVFFGLYTPLQGAPIIGQALSLVQQPMKITMIGSGQDEVETKAAAAQSKAVIKWVDWVEAADLPATVAAHDVCLGIFGTSDKALNVVPNKVYQGAAVGCAIVTSDTIPQRRILGDAALFVKPGDAHHLAQLLDELAKDRTLLSEHQDQALQLAQAKFRPQTVVTPLLQKLRQLQ